MTTIILILVFLLSLAAPIVGAFLLDKRHRRLRPNCRPFGWGYYNALSCFLVPLLFPGQVDPSVAGIAFLVALCIYAPLGILTLRRNRWGYVVLTVFSFNPVLWVINAIYINNRWAEMKRGAGIAHQPPKFQTAVQSPRSFQLETNLYFHLNNVVQGPFTPQQVQSPVQVGTVTGNTLCCVVGSQDWQPFQALYT